MSTRVGALVLLHLNTSSTIASHNRCLKRSFLGGLTTFGGKERLRSACSSTTWLGSSSDGLFGRCTGGTNAMGFHMLNTESLSFQGNGPSLKYLVVPPGAVVVEQCYWYMTDGTWIFHQPLV